MALPSPHCRLFVAGLVVTCAFVPVITSTLPAESDKDSPSGVDKIRNGLNHTLNFEFADMSLKEAIANLREETKLNIVLEVPDSAILDQPANLNVQQVRLRSGLEALLRPYDLGYAILGDVLLITQKEHAVDRQLHQLVNLDLDSVPLAAALKKLARETASNLVIDPRVGKEAQATPLSMQLEEVPLEMAVRIMAEAASLKPARFGNIVFVTTVARANELAADPETKTPAQLQKLLGEGEYMLVPGDEGGVKLVPRTMPGFGPCAGAPGGMP
jgi:hypothetical protein